MTVIRTDAAVGGYTFAMSSGGLVSGLRGIKVRFWRKCVFTTKKSFYSQRIVRCIS